MIEAALEILSVRNFSMEENSEERRLSVQRGISSHDTRPVLPVYIYRVRWEGSHDGRLCNLSFVSPWPAARKLAALEQRTERAAPSN